MFLMMNICLKYDFWSCLYLKEPFAMLEALCVCLILLLRPRNQYQLRIMIHWHWHWLYYTLFLLLWLRNQNQSSNQIKFPLLQSSNLVSYRILPILPKLYTVWCLYFSEDRRTANVIALAPGVECLTVDREWVYSTVKICNSCTSSPVACQQSVEQLPQIAPLPGSPINAHSRFSSMNKVQVLSQVNIEYLY